MIKPGEALGVAATLASLALVWVRADAALLYDLDVTNPGPPTPLIGSGTLTLDDTGQSITSLTFDLVLFGTIFDGTSTEPAAHEFRYGLGDVESTSGLQGDANALAGEIDFAFTTAASGAVGNGDLTLDFTNEILSGFCFSTASTGASECFAGGGTSTGFEAPLASTFVPSPVPSPATSTLLLAGLAGILGMRHRRRVHAPVRSHD